MWDYKKRVNEHDEIQKNVFDFMYFMHGICKYIYGRNGSSTSISTSKYGVPQAKDCGTKNEAHFNGALPECQDEGMYYDKKNRRCDYCEIGYATDSKTDTECKPIVCPAGFGGVIIRDGLCPAGYGLFQITGGNCPAGTILTKT